VQEPRAFGYLLGDVLTQRILLQDGDREIGSVTPPSLGRTDTWLERRRVRTETDDEGRMLTYGKVAAVAVVGNEDGAHHVAAECQQALNEVGFTLPASAVTYWVGEALGSTDYQDVSPTPEQTASMTTTVAANTAHLARLLKESGYPPV